MPKDVLVAVYGSLRQGLGNHRVIGFANGELVDSGKTVNNYNMYSLGAFPSVSLEHSGHGTPLVVEVYRTDEEGLTGPLDGLEGYPTFYNRTKVDVVLDDSGEVVSAWIYHIDEEKDEPVLDGDWFKYKTFWNGQGRSIA
tara:strand:- start:2805 stop:3224 length:420 start_codon:yes stop_codon:yes gene_type:complete